MPEKDDEPDSGCEAKKVNGHFVMKNDACQDIQDIICSGTACESDCATCLVSDANHLELLEKLQSIFKYK